MGSQNHSIKQRKPAFHLALGLLWLMMGLAPLSQAQDQQLQQNWYWPWGGPGPYGAAANPPGIFPANHPLKVPSTGQSETSSADQSETSSADQSETSSADQSEASSTDQSETPSADQSETSSADQPEIPSADQSESSLTGQPESFSPKQPETSSTDWLIWLLVSLLIASWLVFIRLHRRRTAPEESTEITQQVADPPLLATITDGTKTFEIRRHQIRIGALEDNDLVLNHPSVSRYHAVLTFRNGNFYLKDNSSTNHSRVNGEIVTHCPLDDGDQLQFGDWQGYFRIYREPRGTDSTIAYKAEKGDLMTMNPLSWSTAVLTQSGGREDNQDVQGYRVDGDAGCWVVADGLGGHSGGAEAAQLAVEAIINTWQQGAEQDLRDQASTLLRAADQAIRDQQIGDLERMRTTAVMLLARGHQAVWGHVGDSRLYFFRQGRILEQTKDHSVPQMLLAAGEITADEIRNHPDRNRLLASLGDGKQNRFRVRKQIQEIASGDAFLLCTDGFWEAVLEREMEAALAEATSPQQWLEAMEAQGRRNGLGEDDNYTALGIWAR